ncbi:hypothetical protein OG689_04905 [Kitasatospora sp. NBC_00240]|uniref:hypothetical protein n=1 Tax=Kitasatospora sp. NBC_00240 TaxID=2903567 RepID=UPI00224CEACC|nr:hypothetical protein [Kitasatospora sp. NBC_00240]MCX5208640.1 hypothetical protein [Kitasatospora sp. NBC_00240]
MSWSSFSWEVEGSALYGAVAASSTVGSWGREPMADCPKVGISMMPRPRLSRVARSMPRACSGMFIS